MTKILEKNRNKALKSLFTKQAFFISILFKVSKALCQTVTHPVSVIFLCVKFTLFVLLPLRLTTHKKKIIYQWSRV